MKLNATIRILLEEAIYGGASSRVWWPEKEVDSVRQAI